MSVRTACHNQTDPLVYVGDSEVAENLMWVIFLASEYLLNFYSKSSHTYETLWHVDDEPVNLFKAKLGEKAAFQNVMLAFGGFSDVSDICGQTEPIWQGFTANSSIQGDFRPVHCVIAKAIGMNVRMITAIFPHKSGTLQLPQGVSGGDSVWDRDIRINIGNTTIVLDEDKL